MRTLKKTLCMVLVLAMMVGLCAIGASAVKLDDYPDKDNIKNQQAVALLSALGILEGDERGFRPGDTLTRAEGAAIMTRLFNTKGAGVSSFTDMASAAWAQPYVAYCEAQGIIAGMGDGTFQPQGTLTVAQFAKMLICALGYRADIEGLTGNAWEINTVKLINKIDLCAGMPDIDFNAAITRDQAAQMAFNTLKSTMVEYDSLVKVTTGDGTKVEVGANADPIFNTAYSYLNLDANHDNTMQFIETYFPTVKISADKDEDAFGIPTNYWYRGDDRTDDKWTEAKALCDAPAGDLIKTYTTGVARVTYGTIYKDAAFTETNNWVAVKENGVDAAAINIQKNGATTLKKYSGATVLLIKKDGNYTMYVKYPYLAEVTAYIPAASSATKESYISFKAYTGYAGGAYTTFTGTFDTEDFAKKDIVLVYPKALLAADKDANTEIITVTKAEATSGKTNSYGGAADNLTSVTIASTRYDFADQLGHFGRYDGIKLNKDATVYLSNGYAMGLKATTATAGDFIYVLGSTKAAADAFSKLSSEAGYVKQDATTATAGVFDPTMTEGVAPVDPGWYTMAPMGPTYQFNVPTGDFGDDDDYLTNELKDGKYVWSLKPTQLAITPAYSANNNTVFVIKSGIGTYATYTGIKNIPTFGGSVDALAKVPQAHVLTYKGGAVVFYIDVTGSFPQDSAVDPIYVLSTVPTSTRVDETTSVTYYTYSVIKDGVMTTVEAASTVTGIVEGLIVPAFNSDGIITRVDPLTSSKKVVANLAYQTAGDVTFAGGVLSYKDGGTTKKVMLADDVVFCVYDTKVSFISLVAGADADYLTGKTGKLSLVQVSAANTAIKYVYFVVKN